MSYLFLAWHLTLHNYGVFLLSPQRGLVIAICAGELHCSCLMAKLTQSQTEMSTISQLAIKCYQKTFTLNLDNHTFIDGYVLLFFLHNQTEICLCSDLPAVHFIAKTQLFVVNDRVFPHVFLSPYTIRQCLLQPGVKKKST